MGPKKAAATKRKSTADGDHERDEEMEGEKRNKSRGNGKYIGAHVRIQGSVFTQL